MEIAQLYARWASTPGLEAHVLERVLQRSLRCGEADTLHALVHHQQLSAQQRALLVARGGSAVAALVVSGEGAGSPLARTHVSAVLQEEPATLRLTLTRLLRDAPQHREVVWELGSAEARLVVLCSLGRGEHPEPTWSAWLASEVQSSSRRAREVLRDLCTCSPQTAWRAVLSWDSAALVHLVHEQSSRDFLGNAGAVLTWVSAHLEGVLTSTPREQDALGILLVALVNHERSEHGTSRDSEALRILERFQSQYSRSSEVGDLMAARIDQAHDREVASDAEILAALERGKLLAHAPARSARLPGSQIWELVVAHPALTPREAAQVLTAREGAALTQQWDAVCANRSPEWVRELVVACWKDAAQFRHGYQQLREEDREVVVSSLVSKRAMNLHELHQRGCASRASVLMSPMHTLAGRSSDEVVALTRSVVLEVLGTDPGAWEVLEHLAEGFEGSLGELLEAAHASTALVPAS